MGALLEIEATITERGQTTVPSARTRTPVAPLGGASEDAGSAIFWGAPSQVFPAMRAKSLPLVTGRARVNLSKRELSSYLVGDTTQSTGKTTAMLRDDLKQAQISAMKAGDKERLAAVRLILAKVKDRDIEQRTASKEVNDDELVTDVLQKRAKQRRESIEMFATGGRQELADKERGELAVIEQFLPKQMDEAETRAAIEAVKAEVGAAGIKDMGKVMAELKARHGAALDMGRASGWVKEALQ